MKLFFDFQNQFFSEYRVTQINDSYSDQIEDLFKNRASVYVSLKNEEKYIFFNLYNERYSPSTFYQLVQVGDSLEKPLNLDSIILHKQGKDYFFSLSNQ